MVDCGDYLNLIAATDTVHDNDNGGVVIFVLNLGLLSLVRADSSVFYFTMFRASSISVLTVV